MATQKSTQPKTTAQQLGSIIKSARDIMRKDKGLNSDGDRLPMLTWMMFCCEGNLMHGLLLFLKTLNLLGRHG
jgi:hypothetical protein